MDKLIAQKIVDTYLLAKDMSTSINVLSVEGVFIMCDVADLVFIAREILGGYTAGVRSKEVSIANGRDTSHVNPLTGEYTVDRSSRHQILGMLDIAIQ